MSNTSTVTLDLSTDETAKALVSTIRAAVNGGPKYAAYVESHGVTRETVASHAAALATAAYPNAKPIQKIDGKRTTYGNAVQAAGNGLRRALGKDESDGDTTTALLTRAGFAATLDEVVAAWESAQV